VERKFLNSAATPDGTLSTAKAYKTSYITRGNILMGGAEALFCQTETENRGTGRDREAIRRSKPVNYITSPLFFIFIDLCTDDTFYVTLNHGTLQRDDFYCS